jgi:hypothetical protein
MRSRKELNRILTDVEKPEEAFWFCNGTVARNIYELLAGIEGLRNADFAYHVNEGKNDFANWIRGVLKYPELADALARSKDKEEHVYMLRRAIKMLEEAAFKEEA